MKHTVFPVPRFPHNFCLTANEKDFSLSLEMTIWGKRHSRIVSLLRGKSVRRHSPPFLWKEGVSSRASSLGRGCRAQRGGVGFLFCGEAASSLPSPCRESGVILVPSSATSIALTRASQRGAGSILRLFDRHAFSGGNPLHLFSNVLPHRRRGQDRPARGIPLCGCSL